MPRWAPSAVRGGDSLGRVEAPVTLRGYLLCVFAAFGGILFGYDSGYINGVLAMNYFKQEFGSLNHAEGNYRGYMYTASQQSLIVSILSAGTFFGALLAGSFADWIGRRSTIIAGCGIFSLGVVLQVASTTIAVLVPGRLIAGIGIGFVSAVIVLYMSEVAPKAIRGAIVSGYQFCITIGLLLASVVDNGTKDRMDSGSYRIAMSMQWLFAIILAVGLFFLPDSPRWYVKRNRPDDAARALSKLRGQPIESQYVKDELAELVANYKYEMTHMQAGWMDCFRGGWKPSSNLRRVVLGMVLQMMQQWTGVNFIFYYSSTFAQSIGITNAFTISMITTAVNVLSTPLSFWAIEKLGRRTLLIYGALGMLICEFIIGIVGSTTPEGSKAASTCLIVFVCFYIFFFATTWGPGAWVLIGEIFPLPIRSKGVALSTASNWFWNFIIGFITPYLMTPEYGNLKTKVFFLWGSTCTLCVLFAYFFVPETKGLSLEQVDRMLEETTPRNSAKWVPHSTYAEQAEVSSIETTDKSGAHPQAREFRENQAI